MSDNIKKQKTKVLLAKVGLDGHTRGIMVLMQAFKEAGMEVIFPGLYQTPESIARAALEEDVDVVAVSNMSSANRFYTSAVVDELKKNKLDHICVVAGGIIAPEDIPHLESMGVTGNYGPGTSLTTIINHIQERVKKNKPRQRRVAAK